MISLKRMLAGALALTLVGCSAGDATPALVDPTRFILYSHPSGVFTLSLPPDWAISDHSTPSALHLSFSSPGLSEPAIVVYIVTEAGISSIGDGAPMLDQFVVVYQDVAYGDNTPFKGAPRDLQPDGSLRIKLASYLSGRIVQHNDFVQTVGPYFTALRVRLPDDSAQLRTISRIINTFTVNPAAGWSSAAQVLSIQPRDTIEFTGLNAWLDRNGSFEIVGQVINNTSEPLAFIQIQVRLVDSENRVLAQQDGFASFDWVMPGQLAPFSLNFSAGVPAGMVRYELAVSSHYRDLAASYRPQNFSVTSESLFGDRGFLIVRGQVRNDGSLNVRLVRVVTTIFDNQQRVIAVSTTLVDSSSLAPGEISSFTITFMELGGMPTSYTVDAQANIDP